MIAAQVGSLLPSDTDRSSRWFSGQGCVVHRPGRVEVFVGGSLIGSYEPDDRGARNVVLVGLAQDPKAHLGNLAEAFDVWPETLRLIRRQAETEGLDAVIERAPGGSETSSSRRGSRQRRSPASARPSVRSCGSCMRPERRPTTWRPGCTVRTLEHEGEGPARAVAKQSLEPFAIAGTDRDARVDIEHRAGSRPAAAATRRHPAQGSSGPAPPRGSSNGTTRTRAIADWCFRGRVILPGAHD